MDSKKVIAVIRLRINEIMIEKGITNRTQFAKRLGMSRSGFTKMLLHDVERIELVTIEKLCKELCVTPNDLFEITDGPVGVVKKDDEVKEEE